MPNQNGPYRSMSEDSGEIDDDYRGGGSVYDEDDEDLYAHTNADAPPQTHPSSDNPQHTTSRQLAPLSPTDSTEESVDDAAEDSDLHCAGCGSTGHTADACPSTPCSHCTALSHFSHACPRWRKCGRCRRRGHQTRTCRERGVAAGGLDDPCDVCGGFDHAEEECAGLWKTYRAGESDPLRKISRREMIVACYNCGSSTHWGDDCPDLPEFLKRSRSINPTWSAKNARMYLLEEGEEAAAPSRGYGARNGAWQLARSGLFD